MSYTIATVTAPKYAQDGSQGYHLEVVWNWTSATHGAQQTIMGGWVDRTKDGEVIATYDGHPWRTVGSVPDTDWSADWVRNNADLITASF